MNISVASPQSSGRKQVEVERSVAELLHKLSDQSASHVDIRQRTLSGIKNLERQENYKALANVQTTLVGIMIDEGNDSLNLARAMRKIDRKAIRVEAYHDIFDYYSWAYDSYKDAAKMTLELGLKDKSSMLYLEAARTAKEAAKHLIEIEKEDSAAGIYEKGANYAKKSESTEGEDMHKCLSLRASVAYEHSANRDLLKALRANKETVNIEVVEKFIGASRTALQANDKKRYVKLGKETAAFVLEIKRRSSQK
jgi:hypothetical protein